MRERYFIKTMILFVILAAWIAPKTAMSQVDTCNFSIKGSNIYIQSGTNVYINGTLNNFHNTFTFDATPDAQINNLGTIYLEGDFAHFISQPLFMSNTFGKVELRYDFLQYIKGQTINFSTLIINKSNNYLTLSTNIELYKQLDLIAGSISQIHYNIDMKDNGFLSGENQTNKVFGDKAYIIARNRLLSPANSGDISSLGISLIPPADNLGLATIYRRNDVQNTAADGSLRRLYDIIPGNTGIVNMKFPYLEDEWQTGMAGTPDETSFRLWSSTQTQVDQSTSFTKHNGTNDGTTNITTTNNASLPIAGSRWVVADTACDNPPVIPFSSAPVRFCAGDTAILDAGTDGITYDWSDASITPKIKVSASDLGGNSKTYNVIVTASNGCASYAEQVVELYSKPVANFSTNVSYCQNEDIIYTNNSTITPTQNLSYNWSFADGTNSTDKNPIVAYNITGNLSTKLKVTSAYGCVDSATKSLTVSPNPVAGFLPDKFAACTETQFQFANTSTISSGAIATSYWNFGDNYTSTLIGSNALNNELKNYSSPATFTIRLKVVSDGNCVDSTTQSIVVYPTPAAAFTYSGSEVNKPTQFSNLTTISNSDNLSYSWNFGDSSPFSNLSYPNHSYTTSGTYPVRLIAQSTHSCSDTSQSNVIISAKPIAAYTYNTPTDYCKNTILNFTNTSTLAGAGTLSYLWDFGNGNESTQESPSHQFITAGVFLVKLTTTSSAGLSDSYFQNITINPQPIATFSAADVCIGETNKFINNSTISSGTIAFSWNFGDASALNITESPQHIYSIAGSYSVTLTATSNLNCKDTITQNLQVNVLPTASFTTVNQCLETDIPFTNNSSIPQGSLNYYWNFGDGNTSNTLSLSHSYAASGTYYVKLKVISNAACSDSITKNIQVYELPKANFSATQVCQGATSQFSNLSTISTGNLNYIWDFGNSQTSTQTNPLITYSNANSYTISLSAISDKNCKTIKSQLINVYPIPKPNFSFNNICAEQTENFTNSSSIQASGNDAILNYSWNFGNGDSSLQENPVISYTSSGNFDVKLSTVSPYSCQADTSLSITIYPLPTVNFTAQNACTQGDINISNLSTLPNGSLSYSWNFNDGTTSQIFEPKKSYSFAKDYILDLKVSSNYGCQANISKVVKIYATPIANFQIDTRACENTNLTFTNTSSVDNATLSYYWTFGDSTQSEATQPTHSYSSSGKYTVLLTTATANCSNSITKDINVNTKPIANFSFEQAAPQKETFFTNISTIADTSSVFYHWNFGDGTSSTIENPKKIYTFAANYTTQLIASSSSGCNDTIEKNVIISLPDEANFSYTGRQCENNEIFFTDESLFSQAINATYLWDFGDGTTSPLQNPYKTYNNSGTYTVKLNIQSDDGSVYTKTQNITIAANPSPNFTVGSACLNSVTKFTNLSNAGLNPIFSWNFGDGTTSSQENPQKEYNIVGSYSVILNVQTSDACEAQLQKTIVVNPIPVVNLGDTINTCGASYPLDASNSGNSFYWLPGEATTQTINANVNGLWSVKVTDANTCSASSQVWVNLNTTTTVNLGSDRELCSGDSIDASYPGATYLWQNGNTNRYIVVSSSGNYSVKISDPNSCTASDTVSIVINSPINVNLGTNFTTCEGNLIMLDAQNTGSSYKWSTGATTQTIQIQKSGLYNVEVSSSKGCQAQDAILATFNPSPKIDLGSDILMCANKKPITLDAGNGATDYLWSTTETSRQIEINSSGKYYVQLSNSYSCKASDTISVQIENNPIINLGDTVQACSGESKTLDAGISDVNYLWSNGSVSNQNIISSSGIISLQVTDSFGCKASSQVYVNLNPTPNISFNQTNTICENELPIILDAGNSGSSYLWSTNESSQQISVNSAGNYSVIVKNQFNCSANDSISITISPLPLINLGSDTSICEGNLLKLNAQNTGANYLWSTGQKTQDIMASVSANYWIKVTNSSACSNIDSIKIRVNPLPLVDLGTDKELCQGANLNLNAYNPGSTYNWSTGENSQIIAVKESGNYFVKVNDINNCSNSDTIIVLFRPSPIIDLGDTLESCTEITLDANNQGSTYLWSTNQTNQTIKINRTGIYRLSITNQNNCTAQDTVFVQIFPTPTLDLGKDTSICDGKSITLNAKNYNSLYLWNNNTYNKTLKINQSGEYWVQVINSNSCVAYDTLSLSINPTPTFNFGDNIDKCFSDTILLNSPINTSSYLWSDNSKQSSLKIWQNGSYFLEVTNEYNCSYYDTIQVAFHQYPVVDLGKDTTVCKSYLLDAANQGCTYIWSNYINTQTNNISISGEYSVIVTSQYYCSTPDSVTIKILPAPQIDLGENKNLCQSDSLQIIVQGNADSYYWNNANTSDRITVYTTGTYSVTAYSGNGCSTSDTINVNFSKKPKVNLKKEYPLCANKPLTLDAQNQGSLYLWESNNDFASSDRVINIFQAGKYWLKVFNRYNCFTTDTFYVIKEGNAVYAQFIVSSNIAVGDTVQFANLSYPSPFTSEWSFGDGIISYQTDVKHIYLKNGDLPVQLKVSNGVCSDVMTKVINAVGSKKSTLGNENDELPKERKMIIKSNLFPNPSNGQFIVEAELLFKEDLWIDLYNIQGKRIFLEKLSGKKLYHRNYNLSNLRAGFYIIRLVARNQTKIYKLIIK